MTERVLGHYTISSNKTIREVFKTESFAKEMFILVTNEEKKVIGIITDGDFRRAIWKSISLEDSLLTIMNNKFVCVAPQFDPSYVEKIFKTTEIRQIPVLQDGKLLDIIFAETFFKGEHKILKAPLENVVVVMAGGKGSRMAPFTHVLPKALIPIGEKPVIELILNNFAKFGFSDFRISVNHKSKMIKAYFEENSYNFNISYLYEDQPLGTGGALAMLKGQMKRPFFITNCDILLNIDYSKVLEFHQSGNYEFTLVGAIHHHIVPYGVLDIQDGGNLTTLREKPGYDFLVNTGIYLLNPSALELIPEGEFFNITDLVDLIKQRGGNVGVFPISENSWIDIGQWDEYKKTVAKIESFL